MGLARLGQAEACTTAINTAGRFKRFVPPSSPFTSRPVRTIVAKAKRGQRTLHLPIIVELDEDGVYIVRCPILKGCHSYGKTLEEAMANIREAAELCLEDQDPAPAGRFVGVRDLELTVDA